MTDALMTSRGRITIPAEIRKALGLSSGGRIAFTHFDDGTLVLLCHTRARTSHLIGTHELTGVSVDTQLQTSKI